MNSIGSVIDRMSKTQVILGAKKMQLISNIARLSTVLMQTQIARGRIFDSDVASEASRLVKQKILAGAASEMISLASAQKRGLVEMLF
jgi:flagellin-like hook-associated protein FlgL